jgi:hypothetical protein
VNDRYMIENRVSPRTPSRRRDRGTAIRESKSSTWPAMYAPEQVIAAHGAFMIFLEGNRDRYRFKPQNQDTLFAIPLSPFFYVSVRAALVLATSTLSGKVIPEALPTSKVYQTWNDFERFRTGRRHNEISYCYKGMWDDQMCGIKR